MTQYYSRSSGGFYSHAVHGKNGIPADAVEITHDEWQKLLYDQANNGKEIVSNSQGRPITQDRKIVIDIISLRNQALKDTDWIVARHRDELEYGASVTLTAAQYMSLQAWRRALREVTAEMTVLPQRPE